MADLSIIEFGVYGFIAYSSMLMLLISVIKKIPSRGSLAIARSIYLIPGIICSAILALFGRVIVTNQETITNTIRNLNTTEVWVETIFQDNRIDLQSEVWILFHFMLMLVMIIYVILNMLKLLSKHPKEEVEE